MAVAICLVLSAIAATQTFAAVGRRGPSADVAAGRGLVDPERIESLIESWVARDSMVATYGLGGEAEGYHWGNPHGFPLGPTIVSAIAFPGTPPGDPHHMGDVSKVQVARHTDVITGPCTFNGNQYSDVFTFRSQIGERPCAGSGTYVKRTSIMATCESVVAQRAGLGAVPPKLLSECERSASNFTQALNKVGTAAAASAGLSRARYNPNGVIQIEVLNNPTAHVVHVAGGNTYVYATSDAAVSATITFNDDHKSGRQVKQILIERLGGRMVSRVTWF